eukprot:10225000-Alexandrium_andersonii.AAC.1
MTRGGSSVAAEARALSIAQWSWALRVAFMCELVLSWAASVAEHNDSRSDATPASLLRSAGFVSSSEAASTH